MRCDLVDKRDRTVPVFQNSKQQGLCAKAALDKRAMPATNNRSTVGAGHARDQ